MIDSVIFDLDGTLLDTSQGVLECVRFAADSLGCPPLPREQLLRFIGPPLTDSFPRYYGLDDASAWEAIRLFRQHYESGAVFHARPYDGIYSLCETLRSHGIRLAVATNKLETQAVRLLSHFGFDRYCSPICGADPEGKQRKSDLIRRCLSAHGTPPARAVLVGDTRYDAEGAAESGVGFLAVTYGFGFHSREDASGFSILGAADSPGQAAELLLGAA